MTYADHEVRAHLGIGYGHFAQANIGRLFDEELVVAPDLPVSGAAPLAIASPVSFVANGSAGGSGPSPALWFSFGRSANPPKGWVELIELDEEEEAPRPSYFIDVLGEDVTQRATHADPLERLRGAAPLAIVPKAELARAEKRKAKPRPKPHTYQVAPEPEQELEFEPVTVLPGYEPYPELVLPAPVALAAPAPQPAPKRSLWGKILLFSALVASVAVAFVLFRRNRELERKLRRRRRRKRRLTQKRPSSSLYIQ